MFTHGIAFGIPFMMIPCVIMEKNAVMLNELILNDISSPDVGHIDY